MLERFALIEVRELYVETRLYVPMIYWTYLRNHVSRVLNFS